MAERPLQTLKIAPPWRMLLVGKDLEIIVTGLNKDKVNETVAWISDLISEDGSLHAQKQAVQELAAGASFEDLQRLKGL